MNLHTISYIISIKQEKETNTFKRILTLCVEICNVQRCEFVTSTINWGEEEFACYRGGCCFLLFSIVVQSFSVSNSFRPHGLQHAILPCLAPSPKDCSNSCPLSRWCHPTISSSVTPFSSCPQSFPASRTFPMSQLCTLGGQSIGASASASVLPMNIEDWFPLGLTSWISLQSKGLSRVFSNTTVQKHQFFGAQLSL